MTERQLQDAVKRLARLLGYRVYHTYDSRRSDPGYPDLVMVRTRPARYLNAELKSEAGRLTRDQAAWLSDLRAAGVEVHVWRPKDWLDGTIEAVLR